MVRPLRKSFYLVLSIWVNFFLHHQNIVEWILHARQVELVYEWCSFWLSFYLLFKFGDDHVCALGKIVPSNFLSMHWIFMLVRFVYRFMLYTIFIRPWFVRIFHRLHPILSFRWMYIRFIICLFFLLRKAYGRYILASKDFICPCLLASCRSFWMNVQKWRIPIQLCIYLKTHHIYIYIYIWKSKLMQTFIHRHGTCSRASAFRE